MKNKIHASLGGFHLLRSSKSKIENIVNSFLKRVKKRVNNLKKDENIDFIARCHCTGDMALEILKEEFSNNFLKNGVGFVYYFEK